MDDCSNDNTIEIINKYNNIRILRTNRNSGAQNARNIGIKAAKSDWIAFIDSDDEWLRDKIEKQVNALKKVSFDPYTVIHGNCIVRNIDNSKEFEWKLDTIDGADVYHDLLTKSGTLFPSILTSKKVLDKIGYLDEKVMSYQEWDTAIQLSKYCNFIHIEEALFYYNIHNDSISKSSENNINGYYYIIKKYKDDIIRECGLNVYNDHIKKCAVMAMNSKQFKWSRIFLNYLPKDINKIFLLTLSYLRLKPKYIYQSLKYLSWKN